MKLILFITLLVANIISIIWYFADYSYEALVSSATSLAGLIAFSMDNPLNSEGGNSLKTLLAITSRLIVISIVLGIGYLVLQFVRTRLENINIMEFVSSFSWESPDLADYEINYFTSTRIIHTIRGDGSLRNEITNNNYPWMSPTYNNTNDLIYFSGTSDSIPLFCNTGESYRCRERLDTYLGYNSLPQIFNVDDLVYSGRSEEDAIPDIYTWINSRTTQLTFTPSTVESFPIWSPSGENIAFKSRLNEEDNYESAEIFTMTREGGRLQQVTHNGFEESRVYWLHNERYMIFGQNNGSSDDDIWQGYSVYRLDLQTSEETLIENDILHYYVTANGLRTAFIQRVNGETRLLIGNRIANQIQSYIISVPEEAVSLRVSDDLRLIVYAFSPDEENDDNDIYIYSRITQETLNVTNTPDINERWPSFVPQLRENS